MSIESIQLFVESNSNAFLKNPDQDFIKMAILAFTGNSNLSVQMFKYYILNSSQNEEITKILTDLSEIIKESQNADTPSTNTLFMNVAKYMQNYYFYIPKKISGADPVGFICESLLWSRYITHESLDSKERKLLKNKITLIDLYCVVSNPYERYAARNLLSFFDDQELYARFGRVGNYLMPKDYKSKRAQLDAFVALSRFRFGYFTVNAFERPVMITFNKMMYPIASQELIQKIPMGLSEIKFTDSEVSYPGKYIFTLPVFQLYLLIKSSWPYLKDKEVWAPFISSCESPQTMQKFLNEFNAFKNDPFKLEDRNCHSLDEKQFLEIPDGFSSVEQVFDICLLCKRGKSPSSFSNCGHGVCLDCITYHTSLNCPFCTENFTSDDLSDATILRFAGQQKSNIQELVTAIETEKKDRNISFDFATDNYKVIINCS